MSELQVLLEFKKSLVTFFDELIEIFPEEGDLVIIRIFLQDQIPIKDVMDVFNYKMISLKPMVKTRDETFFLEHNVFDELGNKDKVNHFKKIWRSNRLDKEDKHVIWKWVDTFVYLGEKYNMIKQQQSCM
jgi:hypothetical protein